MTDRSGLARALGAGLYPNEASVSQEPGFKKWLRSQHKNINVWEHVNSGDPRADFYAWTQAKELGMGTKLFFTAEALAAGKQYKQALKAYYAGALLFPGDPCWSADLKFVWYTGPASLNKIETITKNHPEIGFRLQGASIDIQNGNDTNLKNDVVTVQPGKWVRRGPESAVDLSSLTIVQQRGYGRVHLLQFSNRHWQMRVDGKPFFVRGLTYTPTKVGDHVAEKGQNSWMFSDVNENGKMDAPYEAWLDRNKNNIQDSDEPNVGDFTLLKQMGVNAIRLYRSHQGSEYDPAEFDKELLRDMYQNYGISCVMGDFLGAYMVGSGATWEEGTDYNNPIQLERMRRQVKEYVMDFREEPFVLMWLIGNENLMTSNHTGVNATRTNADQNPEAYLRFVNEIAEMIHQIDPDHPVAVGNLDLLNLAEHAQFAPAVDIFGANSYRGIDGFGDLWSRVKKTFDRPVLVTEYGMDAFNVRTMKEDEETQATYHERAWRDIALNFAGGAEEGNAIGGMVFEYVDEWWKNMHGSQMAQEKSKDSPMPFPDDWSSEEWLGIMSQGGGQDSPFLRQPRKAYYLYRDKLWNR